MKQQNAIRTTGRLLLILLSFNFVAAAQTGTNPKKDITPVTWTRFFDDCRNNPAFAGLNGSHLLSGSAGIKNAIQELSPSIASIAFQTIIKRAGSGIRIEYVNRRNGFLKTDELHVSLAHSILLSSSRGSFLSAGVEGYIYRSALMWTDPDPLGPQLEIFGLPAIHAGAMYHSEHFFGGVVLNNLRKVTQSFGRSPDFFTIAAPLNAAIYAGYRTTSGFAGTMFINPRAVYFPTGNVMEFGLYVPLKKVILIGLKFADSPYGGNSLTLVTSYMSSNRLRGSFSATAGSANGVTANIGYMLGEVD